MAFSWTYRTRLLLLGFAFASPMAGGVLPAQSNMSGVQNIAKQQQMAWRKVSTEHFDVHYTYDDPVVAQMAARYAEDGLWDHCRQLDYNNKSRFALYLFDSHAALAQSNLFPSQTPKSGGVTPIRNNAAAIVFPGTHAGLQKKIRSEVARLMLEDFYFGGGIQASIQNTVLLHLPEWFGEGMTAYLGEGWDYQDELWMAGLENTNLLNYVLEGDAEINRIARKSIWYFIATQYGREKVAEIFYMTRLARSAEDGVVHVLGITLKTLTERWREFVLHRITENSGFRDKLSEQASKVDIDAKGRVLNIALNPVEPVAAVYMEHDGRHSVVLQNLETGETSPTPIRSGWKTDQFSPFVYDMPMAWSPDGKQLLAVTLRDGKETFAIWNRQTGALTSTAYIPRLDHVLSIDWSHDGSSIVLSALKAGQIDIFRGTPGGNTFVQLTDDLFDDFNPVFSLDDQRVYFSSTRNTADPNQPGPLMGANQNSTDIWEISQEGQGLRQVSNSKWVDEHPVRAVSSFELLVRSNQSGIWNLEKRNMFSGDSIPQTNITQGMHQVQVGDSLTVFTVPEKGSLSIYQASTSQLIRPVVSLKTQFRLREDKANMTLIRAAQEKAKQDSLAKIPRIEPKNIPTKSDTAKSKPVKYYVFDEDGDEQKQARQNKRQRTTIIRKEAPVKPDFAELSIKGPSSSTVTWAADRVSTKIGWDPMFRISSNFEARLRDHKGDHILTAGFTPYLDLRSSDTYLRYQNNKHRLDYWGGVKYSSRYLNRLDFTVRSNNSKVEGGVILPLNRFLSTQLSAHALHVSRSNLNIRVPSELDGRETLAGLEAEIQYDRTLKNGVFVKEGSFARLSLMDVVSFKGRYNQFATLSWDFRKYIPVNHFVFANRLSGAYSAGRNPQQYFVGGTEDWFFGRFENPSDYPIGGALADLNYMQYAGSIRGFRFNARNGSRNLVYNAELRMPLSRIFKRGLNNEALYKFELIPFFDFGTAWTEGNPFSQRNPIDTEVIDSYPVSITVQTLKSPFVMGFGAGTRMQLFGYGVRFDLAWGVEDYTIQKPMLHISLGKNF